MKLSKPYTEFLDEQLQDPEFVMGYLNETMEDDDPRVFLLALNDVARAYGISEVAGRAKLNRTTLYRTLSQDSNPRFTGIASVLDALGLRLRVETKKSPKAKSRKPKVTRSVSQNAG